MSEIKDYQLTHGSLLKLVEFETRTAVPARPVGVSVAPTSFPRDCYDEAIALQPRFHQLYIRAANDETWLWEVLGPLMQHDALFSFLWDIHVKVKQAGNLQDYVCGIFRSDYMLDARMGSASIKQVEMNTFSVAGAVHADRVAHMHHHLQRTRYLGEEHRDMDLPSNANTRAIVSTLSTAHQLYLKKASEPVCILMIVQPYNFNIADERPIEYGLWENDVPCYRCDWHAVLEHTTLLPDRTLMFRTSIAPRDFEVSVVYYRAGYEASEYDAQGIEIRLRLELSRAIKCPDVLTHLTTFKAVQEALTRPGALEHFVPEIDEPAGILQTFMPMHILDDSKEGQEARKCALDQRAAQKYVLKPNLEGGGHNIYRDQIPEFLSTVPKSEWRTFTLMRLIEPPESEGVLMMSEELYRGPIVSELGVIGTCIWKRNGAGVDILSNEVAGWTFKTKPAAEDEMSVVKGFGCFGCPNLRIT